MLRTTRTQLKLAQTLSVITTMILSLTVIPVVVLYTSIFSVVYAVLIFFLIINAARIAANRMHIKELYKKTVRSFVWLAPSAAFMLLLAMIFNDTSIFLPLLVVSLIATLLMLISTVISALRWRPKNIPSTLEKSPTVSICIPARNETQDLPECIETMLSTNYPKLEILVLDDCSHDKTPAVIKEYAHKGVRFIRGIEPDKDWVPKNQAMNKLFDEATGEIIIFAGVDVRFDPQSVTKLVSLLSNGNDMIGVLPKRSLAHEFSLFIQPLRYWWELCVPRFIGSRPPALSTCWAIKREKLKSLGEFDSFRKSVQPEAYFAKQLQNTYGFVISGNTLGISSVKAPRDQYDTAIRTRYPQLKRRLELVPFLLLIELIIFFMPLFGLLYGLLVSDGLYLAISITTIAMLACINAYISFLTVYRTWLLGFITLPFLLFEEWFIVLRSMFAYEFGVVMWKERNICLPMYQVEKELPKI